MATEIERKFLLRTDDWRDEIADSQRLSQGYLTETGPASVRVRTNGTEAYLNIKSMTLGMTRDEYEYEIPLADAERMLATLCQGPKVEKIRHHVHHDGFLWEIDEFLSDNAGLIVAEVELDSPEQTFVRPEWLGDEVTEDPRYYNVSLVRHPFRDWSD